MFARRIRKNIYLFREMKNLHSRNVVAFGIPKRNISLSVIFKNQRNMNLFFATLTFAAVASVFGYYKLIYKPSNSNLPEDSFYHVKIHPEIIKRIGEPMSIKKTISIKEGHNAIRIKYLVSGPSGDATITVDGTLMYRNKYSIDRLVVSIGADHYLLFQYDKKLYTSIVDMSMSHDNISEIYANNLPQQNLEVDSKIIVNLKSSQSVPVQDMNTSVQDMSPFLQPLLVFCGGILAGYVMYKLHKIRKDVGLGRDIILNRALKEIITSDGIHKILGVNIMAKSQGKGNIDDLKAELYQKVKGSLARGKFEVKAEKIESKWVLSSIILNVNDSEKKYKIPFHDDPIT